MQAVPISVLGVPLAFVFLATSAVWSGETTRSCCRRTRCQHDASGDLYGAEVDFGSGKRPCVSLVAPRIQTTKMGTDPTADRFCSFPRLVSSWDDWAARASLRDADAAFCDYVFRPCHDA